MTSTPVALAGFNSPAVGFDQPFEMLCACHERVERTLNLLGRIVEHLDAHGHDERSRASVGDVLRYFDLAGPHHHEDEERHIFPRVQDHPDAQVRAAVAELQSHHIRMHGMWARMRQFLLDWQGEAAAPITPEQRALVQEFAAIYQRHLPLEESLVYPAARSLFAPDELTQIGGEMAARRRG